MKISKSNYLMRTLVGLGVVVCCGATPAHATYEVTALSYSGGAPNTRLALAEGTPLQVSWDAITVTLPDTFDGHYVFLWNTSANALNDDNLNKDTAGATDTINRVAELTRDMTSTDDGVLRYLHIKTLFLTAGVAPTYSIDKVVGPFTIDNVVSGSLQLTNSAGREVDVAITLSVPADVSTGGTVYLADGDKGGAVPTRPSSGVASTTTSYRLTHDTPGVKTIYAWFQDQVGNVSTTPVQVDYTLQEAVSISPLTATINLDVSKNQIFTMSGTQGLYDWSVKTGGTDYCAISGTATGVNSITLQGKKAGTCQLSASPSGGGTAVESGTITVTGIGFTLDVDGDGQYKATKDGLMIKRYLVMRSIGVDAATLVSGITLTGTRDMDQIKVYLESADALLDVDGDSQFKATKDGLMLKRYLVMKTLGVDADTLISGVTLSGTRDKDQIKAYIDNLAP